MPRSRNRLAAVLAAFTLAASGAAMVVGVAPSGAATTYTVTNTADDGSTTSLRGILEAEVVDGDRVELTAGSTYVLDLCLGASEAGSQAVGSGDISIGARIILDGNGATIEQTCIGERVLYTESDLTLGDVTITGGNSRAGGGGVRVDGEGADLVVIQSSIVDNCTEGSGGGIKQNTNGDVQILLSTIAGNYAEDDGGALSHSHTGDVGIGDSTITNNSAGRYGGFEVENGDLTLVYSDIVDNTTGVEGATCVLLTSASVADDEETDVAPAAPATYPANIGISSEFQLISFGSVVAYPHGGPNCGDTGGTATPLANTDSLGFNFSDDATCGFLNVAQGDKQTAGDPLLGALGNNGGPTQTRLPQTGSALIDAIPVVSCTAGDSLMGAVPVDQRFIDRPQGAGCDIGAVEIAVVAPPLIQPTFTG